MLIKKTIKPFYMPIPSNIYYLWNFGSLLGLCLVTQLLTGVFLSIFYDNNCLLAFDSIDHINRNVNLGWLIRSIHANGASTFFIFIYLHISRGLYFKSFQNLKQVWLRGVLILFLLFITAFLGYVLPWGQIRFWGATVITSLLSSIPYIGKTITLWLWGDFSIGKARLIRFFRFHFLIPILIVLLVIIHIILLHNKGSNNPLGVISNLDKSTFNPFFIWKDLIGFLLYIIFFLILTLNFPYIFIDPDNFSLNNPIRTPQHIQPEWYFLFAYAILRTIPNKLGGVIALIISILVLIFISLVRKNKKSNPNYLKLTSKFLYCIFFLNFLYLTLIGRKPIESPFIETAKASRSLYFVLYTRIL